MAVITNLTTPYLRFSYSDYIIDLAWQWLPFCIPLLMFWLIQCGGDAFSQNCSSYVHNPGLDRWKMGENME
jgi:hypothetical protein